MNYKILIPILFMFVGTFAHAYEDPDVDQGAAAYDWQSCIDAKTGDCNNNCATSEDINCADKCADLARDKCETMGLNPSPDDDSLD